MFGQMLNGIGIAFDAKAADDAKGGLRNEGLLPEMFASENVRDMNFYNREFRKQKGIEDSNRRVRVRARVYDDALIYIAALLNPRNQFAFVIALADIGGQAQTRRRFFALRLRRLRFFAFRRHGERVSSCGAKMARNAAAVCFYLNNRSGLVRGLVL